MKNLQILLFQLFFMVCLSNAAHSFPYLQVMMVGPVIPVPVPVPDDNLPPEPGADGHTTLQGIDSDGDGLRDDIQRLIAITFSGDEDTIEMYRQLAKHKIYMIDAPFFELEFDFIPNKLRNFASMKELEYCYEKSDGRDALEFMLKLDSWILSTYARDNSYYNNTKDMHSMIDALHTQYYCNGGQGIVNYLIARALANSGAAY